MVKNVPIEVMGLELKNLGAAYGKVEDETQQIYEIYVRENHF